MRKCEKHKASLGCNLLQRIQELMTLVYFSYNTQLMIVSYLSDDHSKLIYFNKSMLELLKTPCMVTRQLTKLPSLYQTVYMHLNKLCVYLVYYTVVRAGDSGQVNCHIHQTTVSIYCRNDKVGCKMKCEIYENSEQVSLQPLCKQ